jgi:hypothetical protein
MVKGNGSGWLRWLLKQRGVILAPEVISWIWVIVLLAETFSNLPALIGREFLFEIPDLCFYLALRSWCLGCGLLLGKE